VADETDAARQGPAQSDRAGRGAGRSALSRPLLLLALVAGIVVAAVALHAGSGDDGVGTALGPLHAEWLLVLLVLGTGGWWLTATYYARQNERPMGTPREGRLVTLTVTGLVLTLVGTAVALAVMGMHKPSAPPPPTPPPAQLLPPPPVAAQPRTPTGTGNGHSHGSFTFSLQDVLLVVLSIGALVLLALVVAAVRRYLRSRSGSTAVLQGSLEPPAEEVALSAAVSAGRLALHGEDVRAAVIACYAAMEESLAEGGLGRRVSDSPADLLQRASEAGLLIGLAPQQLASLFREARYSTHPMTQAELSRARSALDDIGTLLAERRAAQARTQAEAQAEAQAESARGTVLETNEELIR
jgi:uncharacterized membrane protein YidH (DUF202 family)